MRRAGCLVLSLLFGCSEDADPRPECLDSVDLSCTPLYSTTFDQIYAQTLGKKCATASGGCHGPNGNKGGMTFADADGAFAELTGDSPRLLPGDPACSEVVVRVSLGGHDWSMPPGKPLSSAERCAIVTWIAQGAPR